MAIPNWLTLSAVSGSGDTIITITASTLESLSARTTDLIVSGITKSVTVPVEQKPHEYAEDYLTFDILTSGKIYWQRLRSQSSPRTVQYRINGGEWSSITSTLSASSSNFSVQVGDKVEFKGTNSSYGSSTAINGGFRFESDSAAFNVQGNIMSLVYGDDFQNQTVLTDSYTFSELFYGGSNGPIDASNLVLPATTLTTGCYAAMFNGPGGLVKPPKVLPATNVPSSAYTGMFTHCHSMTTAPVISAQTLSTNSCRGMFFDCYSLATAPELSFTTVDELSCFQMFMWCSGMTAGPSVLPATSLARSCYSSMFEGCTSLQTPPALPATTLAQGCYYGMFDGCSALETAPDLLATTLVTDCYKEMFENCSSLNYIKCLATNPGSARTGSWVDGVASSGTFVKNPNVTTWASGVNGIPTNWSVVNTT
jgi:hypothetical protein